MNMDGDDDDDEFNCSYDIDDPSIEDSCLNDTAATAETSVGDGAGLSDISLSEWDKSFSAPPQSPKTPKGQSTPKKKTNEKKIQEPDVFKAPLPRLTIKLFKCSECSRVLKTAPGLARHRSAHKWKALVTRQPPSADILKHCTSSCKSVLESIASTNFAGEHGRALVSYADNIVKTRLDSTEWCKLQDKLCAVVVEGVSGVTLKQKGKKGAAFPSTLRLFSQQSIVSYISNKEFLDDCIDLLMDVALCVVQVAHAFILVLMRKFAECALTFVYRSMTGRLEAQSDERMSRSKDDFNHLFSQKRIHHVAGASARGIIKHADRYPQNSRLQRRKKCVRNRLSVIGGRVASNPNSVSHWTSLVNRKSLIFINEGAFPFFVEVCLLLQKMEKPDGGLGHEAVMDRIMEIPKILHVWDKIIDGELCEDESFDLMVKFVRAMTNTFGRGIVLRRVNKEWKHGKGKKASLAISHRAKVLVKN